MKEYLIIGTLHSGLTPKNELKSLLAEIEPDQVLVELPEGYDSEKIRDRAVVPDEMLFAHSWAQKNNIQADCFGVESDDVDIFQEGFDEDSPEYQEVLKTEEKIIEKYNWKEFNTKKVCDLLDIPVKEKIFDQSILDKQEAGMLKNIREKSIDNGKAVIITGYDHIDYFHDNLENSSTPLRS